MLPSTCCCRASRASVATLDKASARAFGARANEILPRFDKKGRTEALQDISAAVQVRIDHVRTKGNRAAAFKGICDVRFEPRGVARALVVYERYCARYKVRLDYDDIEERVNCGKIAALQALALLWEAPFQPADKTDKGGLQLAFNANLMFAEFIVQEFLELAVAKYSAAHRRKLQGCLSSIVYAASAREDIRPGRDVVDTLVCICEMLRDKCGAPFSKTAKRR